MAEVKPLKLTDLGSGAGRLEEFATGDQVPKAALPALAKADVGLGNVDNTSDVNKPVSTAQQTALNLKFDTGNVLGTVSQSGGVPTGAIIERGSNANGEYVRFADGTQICTGTASASMSGGVSGLFTFSLPASFVTTSYRVSAFQSAAHGDSNAAATTCGTAENGRSLGAVSLRAASKLTGVFNVAFDITVIGRWF